MQKKIKSTWYPEAKVICEGKVIFLTGSTKPEIHIDIWSGNHPFYTNSKQFIEEFDIYLNIYNNLVCFLVHWKVWFYYYNLDR